MFKLLKEINTRPAPFSEYTAAELWTDEYTSQQMLNYHLNADVDLSSRNRAFIEASAAWIVRRFDLRAGKRVADFGCGPGLYTTRLARCGALVSGVDFSARSIAYAQNTAAAEGLEIEYILGNYLEVEPSGQFDLIIMIMCDYCALSPLQRQQLLQKFRRLLAPGGAVLLDVNALAAFDKRQEAATYEANQLTGFWMPEKYYGFVNTFKYEAEKVVLDKYTIVHASGSKVIYNWAQFFAVETLRAEFASAGLQLTESFGSVAGDPYNADTDEFAVVAIAD